MTHELDEVSRHTYWRRVVFFLKTQVLIQRRVWHNLLHPPPRFSKLSRADNLFLLAESVTPLWSSDDSELNVDMTMGKVQNLRIAALHLDGLWIPAGDVFSFWRHLGCPTRHRGYRVGREIREGCVVPTVAGGLCQLSNGLYDAAAKAGFEIVERHRHTRVIKGSLAESDRDATVKWNYVDFRFRAKHDVQLEVKLTADNLVVSFKGNTQSNPTGRVTYLIATPVNDCYSCGNTQCSQHVAKLPVPVNQTAYVLDEKWPEYETYVNDRVSSDDVVLLPINPNSKLCPSRLAWQLTKGSVQAITFFGVLRGLRQRLAKFRGDNVFSSLIEQDRKLSAQLAKRIPITARHVVVSQNLLPFIWRSGALGGRTFDVLMTRLPIQALQQDLDIAFKKHPYSPTLNDFRADEALQLDEMTALARARHIVTPHVALAKQFPNQACLLEWRLPVANKNIKQGNILLFPSSGIAKKGAYEIKAWALRLGLSIRVFRGALETEDFWQGVQVEYVDQNPLDGVAGVIYPSYIEHQPRLLLEALAYGVPVVTTAVVGLQEQEHLSILDVADEAAWLLAIGKMLDI